MTHVKKHALIWFLFFKCCPDRVCDSVHEMECAVCGKVSPKFCGRCKVVRYCSAEHQSSHWPAHKLLCVPAPTPTASAMAVAMAKPIPTATTQTPAPSPSPSPSSPAAAGKKKADSKMKVLGAGASIELMDLLLLAEREMWTALAQMQMPRSLTGALHCTVQSIGALETNLIALTRVQAATGTRRVATTFSLLLDQTGVRWPQSARPSS
jgi:hypothetical protein